MRSLRWTTTCLFLTLLTACDQAPAGPANRPDMERIVAASILASVPVLDPTGGHQYEAVAVAGGITWTEARDAAASASAGVCPGYLASVTSADELSFIASLSPDVIPMAGPGYWIGGYQPAGTTDPGADWTWLSGETFGGYTPWLAPAPDDGLGEEDAISLVGKASVPFGVPESGWNDLNHAELVPGYVVEFEDGCTLADLIEARVNIRPGSEDVPTPVNPKSQGKIAVAVLSSESSGADPGFDATLIDPQTVTLGDGTDPDAPIAANKHGKLMASWADLDGDGLSDAVLHFNVQDLVSGGDLTAATTELVLLGLTMAGESFSGADAVDVK